MSEWKSVNNFPQEWKMQHRGMMLVLLLLKCSCSQKMLQKCDFQMERGKACGMSDQLHLLSTWKHQLSFDFTSSEGCILFSQPKLLYPRVNEGTSKSFQCHLQTGFCILTFPEIKKIQLALYHLIWMLFNPPFPIVSVSSNFVFKTYFLRPCHMHTHLDVLCAMLCFMLC